MTSSRGGEGSAPRCVVGRREAVEVLVIDAAHDADAIKAVIGSRRVDAILCTHGHNDHIDAAPALAELTGAPRKPWYDAVSKP